MSSFLGASLWPGPPPPSSMVKAMGEGFFGSRGVPLELATSWLLSTRSSFCCWRGRTPVGADDEDTDEEDSEEPSLAAVTGAPPLEEMKPLRGFSPEGRDLPVVRSSEIAPAAVAEVVVVVVLVALGEILLSGFTEALRSIS